MDFWESLKARLLAECRMPGVGVRSLALGLSAPLSSPVLAVVFTAVPGRGFLMPMQCDAGRRAEPRSEKTCDDRVSPIGLRPAGSSLDLAVVGRSPLCESTLAGNTDSTRIRARIICSRTPIRARIIPTETRDVVRCSSLAHGLPVSPPPPSTPSPEWPRSGARVGWVSPGGCGQTGKPWS